MNKLALLFVMGLGFGRMAFAQAGAQEPQLPSGPLVVAQMPNMAQWEVDYSYSDTAKPGQPSALDLLKKEALTNPGLAKELEDPQYSLSLLNPRPVKIVSSASGNFRHQECSYEFGYSSVLWGMGNVVVEKKVGVPDLVAGILDILDQPAFPEFDWISKGNFIGVQSQNGVKCFGFKQDIFDDQHKVVGTKYGYIEVKTLYPVAYSYGLELRKYTFLPPLTSPLEPPEDFVSAGKAEMAKVQAGTPHLAHP
jgi:hypothetical protein